MINWSKPVMIVFCFFLFIFSGCKNPESKPVLQTGKVQINLKTTLGSKDSTGTISKSFVFLTIRDQTGKKVLSNFKVQLLREGSWFASIPVTLPTGNYLIDPVVFWDEAQSLLLAFSTPPEFVIHPNQLVTIKTERASVVRPSLSDSLGIILEENPSGVSFHLSVKAMNYQADSLFFVDGTLFKSIDGTPVSLTYLSRKPQKILISRDSKPKTVSFTIKSPDYKDTTVFFNLLDIINTRIQYAEIQLEPINPIKKQLLAWYTFDGNAKDLSGNNYHGKETQVVYVNDRFGMEENAAKFEKDSQILLGDVFNELDVPFTINFWIQTTYFDPEKKELERQFKIFDSDFNRAEKFYFGVKILCFNGYIKSSLNDGAGLGYQYRKAVISDRFIADGKWHMVTHVIRTFKDMKIYIDNTPAHDPYLNERINGKAVRMVHSIHPASIGTHGKGTLDEIRIFNYVLSEAQIDSLYHEGGWK